MSIKIDILISDNAGQGVPAKAANIGYVVFIGPLCFPEKVVPTLSSSHY